MVTSISEDISNQSHHMTPGAGGVVGSSSRPKLSYLRSLSKQRGPPPAVVITDDSEAYPENGPGAMAGGINPSVFDVLFARPFNETGGGSGPSAVDNFCPSPSLGKINGMYATNSPLRHLGRSFSRDSTAHHHSGSLTNEGSFDASENAIDPELTVSSFRSPRRRSKCCSKTPVRIFCGIILSVVVAGAWVGAAHLLKRTYLNQEFVFSQRMVNASYYGSGNQVLSADSAATHLSEANLAAAGGSPEEPGLSAGDASIGVNRVPTRHYNAPFFTTWFCTLWNSLFFPIYLVTSCCSRQDKSSSKKVFVESIQGFQEKGFTALQFFSRCGFFSLLWVATNYMFVHSLRLLDTTYVVALYCSNVSFVYLLSWVVLHEQFVGIRIVAVILCNTGIALLAYMDGVSRSATLGGVVLAAAAAAGSAVYKVFFKKLVGDVSFGQLSLFFSLVGLLNILLLWPIVLTLYFSSAEVIAWRRLPWGSLGGAAGLSLLANLLGNFGVIWTYEMFLTLGLVFAVPASAVIDIYIYGVHFAGMKLSGIILISVGFFLVMFPQDWPDYLTAILRWRRKQHKAAQQQETQTGIHRSRLRTPSGQVK